MIAQVHRGLCSRMAILLQVALACLLSGCAAELAQRQTPEQQLLSQEWNAYQQALNSRNPEVGEDFLARYPNSSYAPQVREHVEELKDRSLYEPYKQKDTLEGYKEFIANHPDNHFISEAKQRIADLEFKPYRERDSIQAYKDFLSRYPSHPHASTAKVRIDELVYAQYNKDDIGSLRKFMRDHPNNQNVQAARDRIDDIEYAPYHQKNTISAMKDFIRDYPSNRNVADAKDRIRKLSTQQGPIVVTSASLPGNYVALGMVADTDMYMSVLRKLDCTTHITDSNQSLREAATKAYGDWVDAVIGVQYTQDRSFCRAFGTAIHMTREGEDPLPSYIFKDFDQGW